MRTPDYGEMMADAAAGGFDSPEQAEASRRRARLVCQHDIHFPDLEEAGAENNDSQNPTKGNL